MCLVLEDMENSSHLGSGLHWIDVDVLDLVVADTIKEEYACGLVVRN